MKLDFGSKIAIVGIFLALLALTFFTYEKRTDSKIVEVRTRHLIWTSPGCKIYQVRIKNEWGVKTVFITIADPSKTGNQMAVYPTCRVTR